MRYLLGITAAVALGGSAMAADMAIKAPPPMGAGNWTSCYIGGNVAGGWSRNGTGDVITTGPAAGIGSVQIDGGGLNYGGQVGCDYQFSGRWVVGIESKFDAGAIKGNNIFDFPFLGFRGDTDIPWVTTVTARLGYATDPQTMIYLRGGGAFTKDEFTIVGLLPSGMATPPLFTATDNRSGWTVGGGLEHKWWPNVSGFIEYSYINLGTKGVAFTTVAGGAPAGSMNFNGQIQQFMLGLNFRLFGAGPLSASY